MFDGRFRFLPAIVLALVTLAVSPFMGLVRDFLFDALGPSAVKTMAAVLAGIGLMVLVGAVLRIRDRRLPRYAALVGVLALLVFQTLVLGSAHAKVDVVEKVHILQYGALAVLLYRALLPESRRIHIATLALPLIWAGLVGVGEESVQGFFRFRVADIRDVFLNLLAAVCGLLLAVALFPPESWRRQAKAQARVLSWLAILVLAIGVFFSTVHIGYMIEDEEIGSFRSWFTREQLELLSEQKAREWAENPPDGRAWQRKDYYLWEAASHTGHRNASYDAELWTLAWQANLILERYYAPFLDLPRFRGAGRARYGPELFAALEAKATPDPSTYLSEVQQAGVVVWPRGLFFAVLLSVVAFLWSLSLRVGSGRSQAPEEESAISVE